MKNQSAQTLKGFRDFLPSEKIARNSISASLIQTCAAHGFDPLETPTLEYAALLLGKYGDEADALVYTFTDAGGREVGLRYDQTVPTARVLAQYGHVLPKYFRRYQMQNVFRADKPQKGRFREFTQFDIDIFGSKSEIADAEILACVYAALKNIGITGLTIYVNDRQVLFSVLQPYATPSLSIQSIIQTIDKLDKKTEKEVSEELIKKGMPADAAVSCLRDITEAKPTSQLERITKYATALGVPETAVHFQPALARGLDYYTGMIFEIRVDGYDVGSIVGGGRYDTLIESLGGNSIPAVGAAFGFDRVVEVAKMQSILPEQKTSVQIMVSIFGPDQLYESLQVAAELRQENISVQVYPSMTDTLGKQLRYADAIGVPYVVVVGPDEVTTGVVQVKSLDTGQQTAVPRESLSNYLLALL